MVQLPGFDLNPLTKVELFASVIIYTGMHFDLQYSLRKSFVTPGEAKYDFLCVFEAQEKVS